MISLAIPTTTKQDAKLLLLLEDINAQQAMLNNPPYADIAALCTAVIVEQVKTWVKDKEQQQADAVAIAWLAASGSIQTQVKALLGLNGVAGKG